MKPEPSEPKPQLEGYELIEKLGAGGFGEVWSARVPGGMTKAVKFIYGRQDEVRAASELKAMERIREVRHPFVVSLERVELQDGRLMVVSELADSSLRDRFRECAAQGLPGIPRDELLGYLQEIADALDFLANKHTLQHLDVKPENLLLLAGHAKLTDFGLAKSVGDNTQSLIGGMTPAYAAPELFQGAPTQQTDQYSLAVLYQEMLTGQLPFQGQSAAELTLQHMHDTPDLTPLAEGDRFAVSRALSKQPENRYESCREFVLALNGRCDFLPSASPGRAPKPAAAVVEKTTEVFDEEINTAADAPAKLELPPLEDGGACFVPPPESADVAAYAPSLFIGIGGAAALTLRELRQRISERFELTAPLPTMPMLLLDTDPQALMAASRNAGKGAGLTPEETIALPLKRPQEYRDKSGGLLRWLGRRWLYNIPKSLKTEGIRPLGRLALIDHCCQAFQRIRRAMADCVAPESIATAEQLTGVRFKPGAVRVYVVASAAGGTGSGMSLDVAFAVRALLKKMDIKDAQVIGVIPTSTGREPERGELARVNTFAWIAEHQHYQNPKNPYQGDADCGLPSHQAGVSPFDATYLTPLGHRLDEEAFQAACKSLADYLYLDSLTTTQGLLDACRAKSLGDAPWQTLRTFAIKRVESAPAEQCRQTEQIVVNQLLDLWLGQAGGPSGNEKCPAPTDRIVLGAGELVGKLKLDSVNVATMSRSLVEAQLELTTPEPPTTQAPVERLEQIKQQFNAEPGLAPALLGDQTPQVVAGVSAAELAEPLANKLVESVSAWVANRLDQPGVRLCGALRSASWFRDHAESLLTDFHRFAEATQQRLGEVVQQSAACKKANPEHETRYTRLLVDLVALECAARVATGLGGALAKLSEQLMTLKPALSDLQNELRSKEEVCPLETQAMLSEQGNSTHKLVQTADARLQQDWIASRGGLAAVLQSEDSRSDLRSAVQNTASQVVRESLLSAARSEGEAPTEAEWPTPSLAELGCRMRAVAAWPKGETVEGPEGAACRTTASPDTDGYLLIEADGLSAPHLAASIIAQRRDYADFAGRVLTRRDVEWTDLLSTTRDPSPAENQSFTLAVPPVELSTGVPSATATPDIPS